MSRPRTVRALVPGSTRDRRVILLIWMIFIVQAVFFAVATPLWEGFDEYSHYARIEFLAQHGAEPDRNTPVPDDIVDLLAHVPVGTHDIGVTYDDYWKRSPAARQQGIARPYAVIYEAQQPPLFYWLFAVIYRALFWQSPIARVFTLRVLCVLLTSAVVPIGFLIARHVFESQVVASSAALLMIAMPAFIMMSTHVANDALAIPLAALIVLFILDRRAVPLAFALGAGLLAKAYLLPFLLPLAVLLVRKQSRRLAAVGLAGAVVIAGWWYVATWVATGSLTGNILLVDHSLGSILRNVFRADWRNAAMFAWTTFVWIGNWSFLVVRAWMYRSIGLLAAIAMGGVLRLLWRARADVWLLFLVAASFALAIGYYALAGFAVYGTAKAPGWYLAPIVPVISVLMIAGWRAIAPQRLKAAAAPVFVTAFAAVGFFGTNICMLPYYAGLVFHDANGRLPALHARQLTNGGFWTLFERLDVNKPSLITAAVLIALWVAYLLATFGLVAASFWLARKETPRAEPTFIQAAG